MKSKRTKACEIPKAVKEKVYERDNHRCLICHRYVPLECACCHFVPRSHAGLGIEQNILTLCPEHHRTFDQTTHREEYKTFLREYLQSKYPDWNEKNLIYDKWKGLAI